MKTILQNRGRALVRLSVLCTGTALVALCGACAKPIDAQLPDPLTEVGGDTQGSAGTNSGGSGGSIELGGGNAQGGTVDSSSTGGTPPAAGSSAGGASAGMATAGASGGTPSVAGAGSAGAGQSGGAAAAAGAVNASGCRVTTDCGGSKPKTTPLVDDLAIPGNTHTVDGFSLLWWAASGGSVSNTNGAIEAAGTVGLNLNVTTQGGCPVDACQYKGITFKVKGGTATTLSLQLTSPLAPTLASAATAALDANWQTVTVQYADFSGGVVDGSAIAQLQFVAVGSYSLDDIAFVP